MVEFSGILSGSIDVRSFYTVAKTAFRSVLSQRRCVAVVQAFDFLVFFLTQFFWLRTMSFESTYPSWLMELLVSLLVGAMIHCVYQCFGLYELSILKRGRHAALRAVAAGVICTSPFMAPLLIDDGISEERATSASLIVFAALGSIALMRLVIAKVAVMLQRSGVVGRRIYIIANNASAAASLQAILERSPENRVVGTWDLADQYNGTTDAETVLQGALNFLRINPVDAVILRHPLSQRNWLIETARVLRTIPCEILLAPCYEGGDNIVLNSYISGGAQTGGPDNTVMIKISERPLTGWRWVMKDTQDRAIALVLLAFILPLMIVITIAIKLADPGPVFFRQKRFGYSGQTFDIIKFRTMRVADNPQETRVLKLTTRDDPRIFPVGRILRKTSLDELPQLLNVLKGDMWVVGPRPHSPLARVEGIIYSEAIQEYPARYRIKPGITGWAQVCGWRGPTETLEQLNKRVEHDLHYIECWSTFFDVKILLMTLLCVFGHKNAI